MSGKIQALSSTLPFLVFCPFIPHVQFSSSWWRWHFRAGKALHDIRTQASSILFSHHSKHAAPTSWPKMTAQAPAIRSTFHQHEVEKKAEDRHTVLPKDTSWKLLMILPFLSHWLELSHMIISRNKEGWEISLYSR